MKGLVEFEYFCYTPLYNAECEKQTGPSTRHCAKTIQLQNDALVTNRPGNRTEFTVRNGEMAVTVTAAAATQ